MSEPPSEYKPPDDGPDPLLVHRIADLWKGWRVDMEDGWLYQSNDETEGRPLDASSRQALALEVVHVLELVGWCDDPEWTDTTKTVGRLWHKSKPQMDAVPVYRLADEFGSNQPLEDQP